MRVRDSRQQPLSLIGKGSDHQQYNSCQRLLVQSRTPSNFSDLEGFLSDTYSSSRIALEILGYESGGTSFSRVIAK